MIAPAATSAAIPPGGDATIDVTVQLESRESRNGISIINQGIYNKRITKRSIGHVIAYCISANSRARFCNWIYRFPLGNITAMGIVGSEVFHRVAIVGGTGFYSNIGGQVTSVALNKRINRVVFNLEAF